MAVILGAEMQYLDKETVWPHPQLESAEQICDISLDRDNFFYKLLREITERSVALSDRHHFVTLFALGGIADTVAALYGIENLLVDMITKPASVKRAMKHTKKIWLEVFEEFQSILNQSRNSGGIGWAGIWAPGSTFPIQEDFSYMISNEMFREFCLEHIKDMVDVMDYPLYHLDDKASLSHLDTLLGIKEFKAIQWIPGAGMEALPQWYDIIRRILGAGKSVQLFGQIEEVEPLLETVGTRGILVSIEKNITPEEAVVLEKYYSD